MYQTGFILYFPFERNAVRNAADSPFNQKW